QFAQAKGQLSRFMPRLKANGYQRDRAMAEIGVAYFFERRCNVRIIEWEPPGENGRKGEYLVKSSADETIFVEVKVPGWEKDIVEGEGRSSPRLFQPKYTDTEARSIGPWSVVRRAVSMAYPQLPNNIPTLVIIKADYFIELTNHLLGVDIGLYCPAAGLRTGGYLSEDGSFVTARYHRVGAVGVLDVTLVSDGIRYSFAVFDNPNALDAVRLPSTIFPGFPRFNGSNKPDR
ncbi:MAG: hypothetical protein ACREJU_14710, partial [Nitrospiraceae bacterium]